MDHAYTIYFVTGFIIFYGALTRREMNFLSRDSFEEFMKKWWVPKNVACSHAYLWVRVSKSLVPQCPPH